MFKLKHTLDIIEEANLNEHCFKLYFRLSKIQTSFRTYTPMKLEAETTTEQLVTKHQLMNVCFHR